VLPSVGRRWLGLHAAGGVFVLAGLLQMRGVAQPEVGNLTWERKHLLFKACMGRRLLWGTSARVHEREPALWRQIGLGRALLERVEHVFGVLVLTPRRP
jgi:hypothetical protein